jgi:hypothetical protein
MCVHTYIRCFIVLPFSLPLQLLGRNDFQHSVGSSSSRYHPISISRLLLAVQELTAACGKERMGEGNSKLVTGKCFSPLFYWTSPKVDFTVPIKIGPSWLTKELPHHTHGVTFLPSCRIFSPFLSHFSSAHEYIEDHLNKHICFFP